MIGEVEGRGPADVSGCDGEWCRVVSDREAGYLPRSVLASDTPRAASAAPVPDGRCFDSLQLTHGGERVAVFCPRAPASVAPR